MDPRLNTSYHSIDSVDDKRKILNLLDKNANIPNIPLSVSSESDDSKDSSDEESSSVSDSSQTSSETNKKRKKKNSLKRSQKKKKKNKKRKKSKEKSKNLGHNGQRVEIAPSLENCDILKAIYTMNEALSELSKSVEKLEQNVNEGEMLSGFQMQYTMDTLPTFADGTNCIQFQHEDVDLSVPLKTVDDVKMFETILKDSVLRNQVVSLS